MWWFLWSFLWHWIQKLLHITSSIPMITQLHIITISSNNETIIFLIRCLTILNVFCRFILHRIFCIFICRSVSCLILIRLLRWTWILLIVWGLFVLVMIIFMMVVFTYLYSWWLLILFLVKCRSFVVAVLLLKSHFYICCVLFCSGARSLLCRFVRIVLEFVLSTASVFCCVILSPKTRSWVMAAVLIFELLMHSISAFFEGNSWNVKVIMIIFELRGWGVSL